MLLLVMSVSYTPDATFSEEFLLHSSSWFLVRSSFYTPDTSFSEFFPYTPDASLARSFFKTPRTCFSEEFPLHTWCKF